MPYFGNEPSKQAIKIGDNTILSSNIADGVIINADIKSDAAIAMSKTALSAGTGITLSTNTLSVDAAQTQITSVGTLTTLTVDDITINGSTISDSGDLTLDIGADIILDAGGNEIKLKTGGTEWGQIYNSSSDLAIYSSVQDKDIKFQGNDGGSVVTALTLDMSEGGNATFVGDVSLSTAGKRYYIPRESDGALTGSLYSSTGNTITLSGAGSSSGIINFIPSASNSSAVVMTMKANGEIQFGDSNNTASLYHYGEGKFAINDSAGSASTPTYAFNSDTDTGMYRGGANDLRFATGGTQRMQIESDGTVVIAGALQPAGNITQSASGNLRHTITAGGSGEAALVLTANNTTGDSFVRWETNANTFCMGLDNSDSNKFILSCGSDPHSDSVINIQPDGSSMAIDKPISFNGAITTASTVLISGVSNYTGLEVKGSGGSRPQIKWSNVNNGVMGAIYGTESNGLVVTSGTSGTSAMTISSAQEVSLAVGVKFESNKGSTTAKLHWYHANTTGNYQYYHLKTDIGFGTAVQMYSLQFEGHSYNTGKAIDTRLVFYNYSPSSNVIEIGSTGNHTATVYESSDNKVVLRLDLTAGGAYYSAFTLSSFNTQQGCVDFSVTSIIHSNNTNDFA